MPRAAQSPVDKTPTKLRQGGRKTAPHSIKASPKRDGTGRRAPAIEEARARGINTSTYAGAELIDENKPLTQMQKDFVKAWASGESILSASQRAGYADAGTYAYRMVRMPNILALYNAEKRAYEEASGMTRKKVMDGLLEAVDMAKLAGEPASMVAGWKTIGQMCGYFEPVKHRVEVSVNGSITLDRMNRLSDAELLRLITQNVESAAIPLLEGEPDEEAQGS